jgi:hypothetical protein
MNLGEAASTSARVAIRSCLNQLGAEGPAQPDFVLSTGVHYLRRPAPPRQHTNP